MNPRLIVILVFLCQAAFSQDQKITVRIVEAGTEKPIKDANIIVPGSSAATFSNHLGYFELTVDRAKHSTLQISHIGYKIFQVQIPEQDRFKLYLQKDTVLLNSVNLNSYPGAEATAGEVNDASQLQESEAMFTGGLEKFYDYIGHTLAPALPDVTNKGFSILFTIDETGHAVDLVISDPAANVQTAVIDAFQKMPAWTPATQRQKNVREMFKVAINRFDPQSLNLKELITFIQRNIKYPAQARRMGIEGIIHIQFSTDATGTVKRITLLNELDESCNTEARRIISVIPANILKPISDQTQHNEFMLPLLFSLDDKPSKKQKENPQTSAYVLPLITVVAGKLTVVRREIGYGSAGMSSGGLNPGSPHPSDITYFSMESALQNENTARRLMLKQAGLNSIPADILLLTKLNFLDLENNSIPALPNEFAILDDLKELYLPFNKLTALPENFGTLKKLRTLGLGNNQFKTFPLQITLLEKLESLDLSNNQLTEIPAEIGLLKNLKVLMLADNSIKSIPAQLLELKNLEKIYLQGNPLKAEDLELLRKTFKKAEIAF